MREFTEEEVKEIIRTAQIFAPAFNEEQYRKLIAMKDQIGTSGFIEAAYGVHRLEQQYGLACSEAPDKYIELVKEKGKLELKVSGLRQRRQSEEKQLADMTSAIRQATQKQRREEKQLEVLKKRVETEKRRLQNELEQARKEALLDQEEITIACRVKVETESRMLDLEVVLKLFEQFAGNEDAARSLAEAVTEYGSLVEAREILRKESDMLKIDVERRQDELAQLQEDCQHYQQVLSQLKVDLAEEEALRRFRQRFHGASKVLEYLSRWEQVIPARCRWVFCGARFWVDRGPTNFRTKIVCPCCSLTLVDYDEEAFLTLGHPYGTPVKIQLG